MKQWRRGGEGSGGVTEDEMGEKNTSWARAPPVLSRDSKDEWRIYIFCRSGSSEMVYRTLSHRQGRAGHGEFSRAALILCKFEHLSLGVG